MIDLGNRSSNRILIDRFACSYFLLWTLVSLYLQMRHLSKERERENSLQIEAIFSCLLLSDICIMPASQPGSSLTHLLSFSSGSAANTPRIHQHRISWKSKKTDNGRIYKEARCPLTLKCCGFVFMWPQNLCAHVCLLILFFLYWVGNWGC